MRCSLKLGPIFSLPNKSSVLFFMFSNQSSHMTQLLPTHQFFFCSSPNHKPKINSSPSPLPSFKVAGRRSLRSCYFSWKEELENPIDYDPIQTINATAKSQNKPPLPNPEKKAEERRSIKGTFHSGIFASMWWADMKAGFGQRFNLEGIICSAKVVVKHRNLAMPQATVPDIRWIDWAELRRRGFRGVVFDKDNTITLPYVLAMWAPLKPSVELCKSVFGDDNVVVFSNSAGLYEFDPDGSKAREMERETGIRVIRHRVKKPAGSAEEIEKHFGFPASMLALVGDRRFTDIVYGNRNGFLTILTEPLSLSEEPFIVQQVRKIEAFLGDRWCRKGLKPISHSLLPDGQLISLKNLHPRPPPPPPPSPPMQETP
ncbi:hypothetical protein Nepgr_020293 [Nepenthes gracilis]|uniref:Uncharacterized protein n=1 Tax=Nepenthes gracilis TaxID=150966 RepID=A0AAD3SXV8_NEPGR|nr:hypothetical protein Nepgr_020293 [Nepenthes gracilis]